MPAGISENGLRIIQLVSENEGKLTREKLIDMFEESAYRSVAVSIGRLMGTQSQKLREDEKGFIWLNTGNTESDVIVHEQVSPSILMTMPFAYEEFIEVPDTASGRDLEVVFEVTLRIKKAKRVGITPVIDKSRIIWLPPGAAVLRCQLGEFEATRQTELMPLNNYLAVVTKNPNNGYSVRYYQAPEGERFALEWSEE